MGNNVTFDLTHTHIHVQKREGIEALEAMLFTLDEVNRDKNLLPGIKLGVIALDSCNSPNLALTQCLHFIKGEDFCFSSFGFLLLFLLLHLFLLLLRPPRSK